MPRSVPARPSRRPWNAASPTGCRSSVARTRGGAEVTYARAAVSLAAHAGRVEPLDGIYADFRDAAGLAADTRSARALGYTGKMVIHPAQIAPVHAVFAPSPAEVDHAR